jgi:hypothetical protein
MFSKIFGPDQKTSIASNLYQVIDVIQEDFSGSATRRKYETFVTGSGTNALTSSLYQTIYDQDFTLQTANPVLDMTMGLFFNAGRENLVKKASGYALSTETNQLVFDPKETVMMREKVNLYRQYAQFLLGKADAAFTLEVNGGVPKVIEDKAYNSGTSIIDAALFINVKRLFSRDGIRQETFAMRIYKGRSVTNFTNTDDEFLANCSENDVTIIADIDAANSTQTIEGNKVSFIKNSSTNENVGLLFYEAGIAVLNLGQSTVPDAGRDSTTDDNTVISGSQLVQGLIDGITVNVGGQIVFGNFNGGVKLDSGDAAPYASATVYPDLFVSASIDNIIDYIGGKRFSSGSLTAMAFQNTTKIQSSLYFCRAGAMQWTKSSNPTWGAAIGDKPESEQFTYITSVGLVDASGDVVAIAKVNRPIEKDQQSEVSIRVRLDF